MTPADILISKAVDYGITLLSMGWSRDKIGEDIRAMEDQNMTPVEITNALEAMCEKAKKQAHLDNETSA